MTVIGFFLLCWGIKSLYYIQKKKNTLRKSNKWANIILTDIENDMKKDFHSII